MNYFELDIECTKIRIGMCRKFVKESRLMMIFQLSLAGIIGTFFFYGGVSYTSHGMFQAICFGTFVAHIFYSWASLYDNKSDLKLEKEKLVYLENKLAEKRYEEQLERSKFTSELTKRLNGIYPENTPQESVSQSAEM